MQSNEAVPGCNREALGEIMIQESNEQINHLVSLENIPLADKGGFNSYVTKNCESLSIGDFASSEKIPEIDGKINNYLNATLLFGHFLEEHLRLMVQYGEDIISGSSCLDKKVQATWEDIFDKHEAKLIFFPQFTEFITSMENDYLSLDNDFIRVARKKVAFIKQSFRDLTHDTNNYIQDITNMYLLSRKDPNRLKEYAIRGRHIADIAKAMLNSKLGFKPLVYSIEKYVFDNLYSFMTSSKYSDKNLNIVYENNCKDKDDSVSGSNVSLKQVLYNMIKNAVNDDRGNASYIKIKASDTMLDSKPAVELLVMDDGNGMPSVYGNNIVRGKTYANGTGTGIGLSISKEIIEQVGGKLEICPNAFGKSFDSKLKGACFRIVIPKCLEVGYVPPVEHY